MPNPERVGIVGAGTFGTAMANLAAHNAEVMVYSRRPELLWWGCSSIGASNPTGVAKEPKRLTYQPRGCPWMS